MAVYLQERKERTKDARHCLDALLRSEELEVELKFRALERLATLYWYYDPAMGEDAETAEELYAQSLDLARSAGDKVAEVVALAWLGNLLQRTKGRGEERYRQALKLCEEFGDECPFLKAWLHKELADACRLQGKFDEAERLSRSSAQIWARMNRHSDRAHAVRTLAMVCLYAGKVDEADKHFREARRIFADCGSYRHWEQGWIQLGLGDVALARGDMWPVEKYRETLRVWDQDPFGEAMSYGQLAEVHFALGEWDKAVEAAKESIEKKHQARDRFGIGWSRCTLGNALLRQGLHQDALGELNEGLRVMREYGSFFGQSRIAVALCRAHYLRGDLDSFKEAARSIEEWGKQYGYHDHLAEVAYLRAFVQLKSIVDKSSGNALPRAKIRECATLLSDALEQAYRYNTYLVDSVLHRARNDMDQIALLRGDDKAGILKALLDAWVAKTRDDAELASREAEQRGRQRTGRGHDEPVIHQLKRLIQELGAHAEGGAPKAENTCLPGAVSPRSRSRRGRRDTS